jgi:hypothetical protein
MQLIKFFFYFNGCKIKDNTKAITKGFVTLAVYYHDTNMRLYLFAKMMELTAIPKFALSSIEWPSASFFSAG